MCMHEAFDSPSSQDVPWSRIFFPLPKSQVPGSEVVIHRKNVWMIYRHQARKLPYILWYLVDSYGFLWILSMVLTLRPRVCIIYMTLIYNI